MPYGYKKRNVFLRYGMIASTLLVSSVESSASVLEEVIVTAQKRQESIQDVGIAITAFSGDQMKSLGIQDSVDVAAFTPSVATSGSFAGQMMQFSIRGVTQNDFNDHVETPNAVYIDEGYVAMQQGQMFSAFDVARVEVLKGPQGTLFGRNATGGLIHFISEKPTEDLEGYVDVTIGDYNQRRFEGAISGPLSDNVSGRLSGMFNRYDPYLDNKYPSQTFSVDNTLLHADPAEPNALNAMTPGEDLGDDETWAVRGQLLIDISDDVQLHLIGFGSESEMSVGPYQNGQTIAILDADGEMIGSRHTNSTDICEMIGPSGCVNSIWDGDGDGVRPQAGGDFFGYIDPDGNDFTTSSDYALEDRNRFETVGLTAKLTVDFDNLTLTSVTDFKDYDKDVALDLEGGPANQFLWLQSAEAKQFSQELRLNGETDQVRWQTGFYYLNIENENISGLSGLPNNVSGFGSFDEPREANLDTDSYSLFGQVDYSLSESLTLIAGARLIKEEKDYEFNVGFVLPSPPNDTWDPLTSPILTFNDETDKTLWTAKLQLDWQLNNDVLLYGGINRGVKAGSFNSVGSSSDPAVIPYDEEVLMAYEVGFKSTFMDESVRVNGALYYYDYTDYQATRWLGFSNQVINNDATTFGGELEIMANLATNLDVIFNVGIFDAEVEDVQINATTKKDAQPSFAPELTAAGLARYTLPQSIFGGELSLQADATYQSETFYNLTNFDSTRVDGYALVNLRATWVDVEESWQVDAFVKNVNDKRYNTVGFDLSQICGCNEEAQGKPRWWGVSVRKSF